LKPIADANACLKYVPRQLQTQLHPDRAEKEVQAPVLLFAEENDVCSVFGGDQRLIPVGYLPIGRVYS